MQQSLQMHSMGLDSAPEISMQVMRHLHPPEGISHCKWAQSRQFSPMILVEEVFVMQCYNTVGSIEQQSKYSSMADLWYLIATASTRPKTHLLFFQPRIVSPRHYSFWDYITVV